MIKAILHRLFQQSMGHAAVSPVLFGCEQTHLADRTIRRQIRIEILELFIQRKRPLASHRQHADDLTVHNADDIGVLLMKLVYQDALGISLVLRDLLDKRLVIETVDLLELPGLRRYLEYMRACHFPVPISRFRKSRQPWRVLPESRRRCCCDAKTRPEPSVQSESTDFLGRSPRTLRPGAM